MVKTADKKAKASSKRGRPSKVQNIDINQLKFLIEKGFTDGEICQFFEIDRSTFWRLQQSNPELCNTIKEWKTYADQRAERSLYERACGYSHEHEEIFCAFGKVTRVKTIKHYPPSELACIMWLKNRQPAQWREKPPEAEDEELKDTQLSFTGIPGKNLPEKSKRYLLN